MEWPSRCFLLLMSHIPTGKCFKARRSFLSLGTSVDSERRCICFRKARQTSRKSNSEDTLVVFLTLHRQILICLKLHLVLVLMSIWHTITQTNSPARSLGECYSVPNSLLKSCFTSLCIPSWSMQAAACHGQGERATFCVPAEIGCCPHGPQSPPIRPAYL